jgi:hypothetical protein
MKLSSLKAKCLTQDFGRANLPYAFSALILGNLRLYLLSICKYAVLSAMLIVRSSNVLPRSLSDCKFAEVHQLSSGNDYLLSRKRILASTSLALNTRGT